ncbi:hypothetical protein ABIA31_003793 [Catenulispora sp. MAP5-51]|uniref:YrhB domain-containing protein n=1 Tax=Catenulispora sp. MAP5-51 TaxID=3156298 RepID=UPI0035113BF1
MVSREWATEVVEAHLATLEHRGVGDRRLVVVGAEEHRLGWFVFIQCARFARTRSPRDLLAGPGYYLVDGVDGSLHHMHATADQVDGGWIEDYLEEVRGIQRPDPLRSRVAELVRSGERLAAISTVRGAAAGLSPESAIRYVDAVAAGVSIPVDVADLLPKHVRPAFAVRRPVTGPNPEPTR